MRILYVTTIGITMNFFKSLIRELLDDGHIVDIMCNEEDERVPECYREWGCKIFHHSCTRSPLNSGNIKAIKEIRTVVKENNYDVVHCHTPIAAACTRFACKNLRKQGLRVIYTAHGFHFYKGAPLKNWLLYYPIEWLCSYFTDTLITINKEDYERAKKKFHAKQFEYVPGVGVDIGKFADTRVDRRLKRKELGIPEDAIFMLSVGELNKNKNHQLVIKAVSELADIKICYAIAGDGSEMNFLKKLSGLLNVEGKIFFLGYRKDVPELYQCADVYILPSIREGLNVSVMEAMASDLPCIVSNIRGNSDLIDDRGGSLFESNNIAECKKSIENVIHRNMRSMGEYNNKKVNIYSIKEVNKRMTELYNR